MTGTGPRAARGALDQARAALDLLDDSVAPDDSAATVIEAWSHMEAALKALAGTGALTGQALLRELRQRDLLSLAEAHALIDGGALAERARDTAYRLTAADATTARTALDHLTQIVDRGGAGPARPVSPVPPAADAAPAATAPVPSAASRSNALGRVLVVAAALAALGGGGYALYAFTGVPSDLRRGRAAYAAGDRLTARNVFAAAAGNHPTLAEPHLYLGRMAREAGDLATANEELRRAVALEPTNPATHRELAALLLVSRRPDLARAFYERAIRLDPEDRTALGYMGCTMLQLGRPDVAQRFLARAGAGPWTACTPLPLAPTAALPVPPGALPPR